MRRTHRIVAVLAATLVGFAAPALAATQRSSTPEASATLDAALVDQLASVGDDVVLTVIAHGVDFDAVAAAADGAGVTRVADLPLIDALIAVGTADQIQHLAGASGVTHLEADQPLEYLDETSNQATRGADLIAGYDVTVETAGDTGGDRPPGNAYGWDKNEPSGAAVGRQGSSTGTEDVHVQADGSGVSVAIIDSGVDGTHPAFAELDEHGDPTGASRVVVNKKFSPICAITFDSDGVPGSEPLPCFGPAGSGYFDPENQASVDVPGNDSDTISAGGHGTHVAGIAAGGPFETEDGRIITGAAPKAKIVALSVGAALSVAAAVQGQYWVLEHHADPCGDGSCPPIRVVNNSYGPKGGGEFDRASATVEIQRRLAAEGVVMVWAAGNDGGGGADNRTNPPGQDPTPGILMVANYNDHDTGTRDGSLASSSSRGDATRQSTWPDISAPGTNITSACRPTLAVCSSGEGDAGTISGTSMATPHVVGIVAQLFELVPEATPAEIENTVEDTAHQFSFGGGYYPDFRNNDHSTSYDKGHGLIDAKAAANELLGLVEAPAVTDVPSCAAGDVLIRDPAGDGYLPPALPVDPGVTPAEDPTSDDSIDLRSVEAVETDDGLDVVFTLTDVTGGPPEGRDGSRMHLGATMGDATRYVAATISADEVTGEPSYGFGIDVLDQNVYNQIVDLTGEVDVEANTVTVHVTNDAIDAFNASPEAQARGPLPRMVDGTKLTGLTALTQTSTSAVVVSTLADADAAGGQCAFEYGIGAIDPEGPRETPADNDSGVDQDGEPVDDPTEQGSLEPSITGVPIVDDATLEPGDSYEADGVVETTNVDYSCVDVRDEVCLTYLVRVTAAGTLTVGVEARTPVEDFDLAVYDGVGEQVASYGNPGTPPAGLEGGSLDVVRGAYFVQVQPYLTEGSQDGLTGGSTYTLTVSLS